MTGGGLSAARVREVVRKELKQMLRDPRMKRMVFMAPIVQLLVFGYAVTTDIRNTRIVVVDHDRTAASRALVEALRSSGYFRIVGRSERSRDLVRALDHGDATLGLEIPRGFARDLAAGAAGAGEEGGASVQLLVDGTSSNTALVAQGYANQIVQRFGLRASRTETPSGGPAGGVDLRSRAWFNPNLESRTYNVPAVAGVIVMMMGLLLTALAVVREREIGTLEQLMVSPLKPAELILGKTLPATLVALVDLALVTAVAILWFGVPMRGSLVLLLVASLLYILLGLGLGLLISTVSSTQQEAFMTMFLFFLPAMLLSGLMFPVSSMPEIFQWITLVNPIRHYLEIVRGIFLKGAGVPVLWPQLLALALMGPAVLWFATTRFHKTIA